MKLNLKLAAASLLLSAGLQAQNQAGAPPHRTCATPVPSAEWDNWFNQKVDEYKQNRASGRVQSTNFTIPVIVHVIHGGQAVGSYPNISQAQVNSQIAVLNNDFAGTGLNVSNLAATAFSAVGAANCSISFCLAQMDPFGNQLVEPGIDRVNYVTNGWTNPASSSFNTSVSFQNNFNSAIKPNTIWDATRYFNIWVSDEAANVDLLGYATFPIGTGLGGINNGSGTGTTDGVWVWAKAFGNTGSVLPPYNKGRTATHEIGHWLGLRHIGGDGNNNVNGDCNASDFCNDTPPQKGGFSSGQFGQNFGSPSYPLYATGPNSCSSSPNGCMFMNFMDYVDDAACYMFTPDQSSRMTTAMTNGTYRSQLTASSLTLCSSVPAVMPSANFSAVSVGCIDSLIALTNASTGTPTPSYQWLVSPTMPGTQFLPNSTSVNPNIKFLTPSTYTITLQATNTAGMNSTTRVITVNDCSIATGLSKNSMFDRAILLSPNPSTGVVNISSAVGGKLDVSVHNYLGQFVTSASFKDVANYSLDLGNYANGVYFITISNGEEKTMKRLILNK